MKDVYKRQPKICPCHLALCFVLACISVTKNSVTIVETGTRMRSHRLPIKDAETMADTTTPAASSKTPDVYKRQILECTIFLMR